MAENNKNQSTQQQAPQQRGRMRGPGHGGGHGRVVEKPKNFKKSIGRLISYIAKYKAQIFIVAVFAACSTVFAIQSPKILGNATTEIFNGVLSIAQGGAGIDMGALLSIIKLLAFLYTISALFSFMQSYIMNGVTQKISFNLRRDINDKLHTLPMSYFDKHTNGEILSYITNDVDTVTQGVSQSVTQIISSLATVIGVLYMMLSMNVAMTGVVLLIVPISGVLIMQVVKRTQPLFKKRQATLANVNGIVEENYGGHTVLKAFNHEETSIADFEVENENLYNATRKSEFLGSFVRPIMDFMGNLLYVAIAVLGAVFASQGKLTVGNIQSFLQYSKNFSNPINQIAQISNQIQSTVAAAERVFALLDETEEPPVLNPQPLASHEGRVDFENVRFGYDPEKVIIHDFKAYAKPGRKIAIVGPTGAGKTTIVKLLMRFYDLQTGKIMVDGVDIATVEREELREMFGMVLQDTWLFSGTIMENIRYSKPEATDEEVIAAAKAARADHFIRALPEGYDLVLNEEATNISQGQKQLLTIARAFLRDPKILILDEATSSVDTRTEIQIQKAMDTLMVGRTTFVIAHRLSTIRDANLILVMDNGDIVEQGKHEELLAKGGFYANLYNSQFETSV